MADARSGGRYLPLFPGLLFESMVEVVVDELESSPLRYRRHEIPRAPQHVYGDLWQVMRPVVEQGYILDSGFGPFEVWQRRGEGMASGREGAR